MPYVCNMRKDRSADGGSDHGDETNVQSPTMGSKMRLLMDRLVSEPMDWKKGPVLLTNSKECRSPAEEEKTRGLCGTSNKSTNVQMTGNLTQVLGPVMALHMAASCFPLNIKVQTEMAPKSPRNMCQADPAEVSRY